jgi:hypothetical protein
MARGLRVNRAAWNAIIGGAGKSMIAARGGSLAVNVTCSEWRNDDILPCSILRLPGQRMDDDK